MNNFVYCNTTKVYFGNDVVQSDLPTILNGYGDKVMLAYGGGSIKKNGLYDEVMRILTDAGKTVVEWAGIMPNPTYAKVLEGAKLARENDVDLILAVGGGSVSDCCKIVSAQAKTSEDIWEMETVQKKYPTQFIPLGVIVTVAGTGSEMNNGAVITNEDEKIKTGLLGAQADFALLDPNITMSVPMRQVISGAFDTLSHAMETYFGKPARNNLSDDINEALQRSVIAHTRTLLADPNDYDARSELLWAASMAENGILKIGKQTDFECHQMEHQIGAYTNCNHGAGLAVLHPVYYRYIYKDGLDKFRRWAVNVWGVEEDAKTPEQIAKEGIDALEAYIHELGLPSTLRELGVTDSMDLKHIADSVHLSAGSCKDLTHEDIYEIFKACR